MRPFASVNPHSPVAAATIIGANYLAHARVLARSFHRFHPGVPLFVLLVDRAPAALPDGCVPLRLEQTAIAEPKRFRARRSVEEAATAAKPFLLELLLRQRFSTVVFIDPDVLIVGDLEPVFAAAAAHAILLTPHLLTPPRGPDGIARERNILQSGVFNGGLLGVSDTPAAHRFLAWWADRVEQACRDDVVAGLYFDQRWLDFALPFFRDVHLLRDPGCNVAHWNLPDREVRVDGDRITVDGYVCRFVHFSGFDPARPDVVSRYAPRRKTADTGDAAGLFRRYASLLREAGGGA